MLSQDLQPHELLQYLPKYKVVVCTSCQYAVQPNAISRHLKDIHHIIRSYRRPFMQYVSKLDLDEPQKVVQSTNAAHEFPIPELPVQDGLICGFEACGHLCASTKRMRSHWVSAHGRQGEPDLDWRSVPLQTFFRGNLLRYFTDLQPGYSLSKPGDYKTGDGKVPIDCLSYENISRGESIPDAVLLNHYTTVTSLTIADDPPTVHMWQTLIPQLAQDHPFLMHGLLAISALHLAHLHPSQKELYLIKAGSHQDLATPAFRHEIGNVSTETCDAVFTFAHLLAIYSFASEKEDERLLITDPNGPDVLSNWLFFLRSGCDLAESIWDNIMSGPLAALSCAWEDAIAVEEGCKTLFVEKLLSLMPLENSTSAWPDETSKTYSDAAFDLGYAYACADLLGESLNTWELLRIWPMRVSLEYMHLLNSAHPGALILLAYYCVLLKKLEGKWFFEGRAERLMGHILKRLDVSWQCHVKWPIEKIGFHLEGI